ncbi:ribosome maturation factor RimP [Streptomyces sp. 1114.5]|uniref:ribosome maturation factor RimP n=1 Tax=unclassified Streptomyces TaxID=2593676 RepID=UPI000BCF1B7D|nr:MULTISPECIES: ribosome maturation factor RimP [unclassified Streptomyces]RKT17869.1 ribosome maturation factor RimP [Streptomyces sp. 1114.5]SOB84077.1 ribosome maturation factor RimP [Streptomyces sp. 1331.2]
MSTTHTDRLRELLEPLAAQAGLDLEDVRVTKAGSRRQVQIDVDTDGGVDMDAIAEFSRVVGEALDGSDLMGDEPYLLEVGSPGAERPLVQPRHWQRAEGRLAKIHLADGGEIVARVLEADEDGALVEVQPVKGRGRPKERRLAYAEVARARVQVEFNRKDDELLDEAADFDEGDDGTE